MRVAVGRMWQESNDLSTVATTRADWEANGMLRGPEIAALAGQVRRRVAMRCCN